MISVQAIMRPFVRVKPELSGDAGGVIGANVDHFDDGRLDGEQKIVGGSVKSRAKSDTAH
ncbi:MULTISPECIES: hypothetical protein [unclassified Pseudomonas]|uniref:hypothetical protein n=1 Tax=Pseudomonas TaxID=286 RepID=UPI0024B34551|nr:MULTISPECIES: hypothetical protein [unclassified Pseudomonas]